jgi:hypothetical protein
MDLCVYFVGVFGWFVGAISGYGTNHAFGKLGGGKPTAARINGLDNKFVLKET